MERLERWILNSPLGRTASRLYERRLLAEVIRGKMPRHVAIIMDGNRRFASKAGLERAEGHAQGAKKLEEVLGWCRELGIKHVTVFAFSTENFDRSEEEVEKLMEIFEEKFRRVSSDSRVHEHRIRIRVMGDLSKLPPGLVEAIRQAEEATKSYDGYSLNLALAYGGRAELVSAIRRICKGVELGELKPSDVDERVVSQYLYTAGLPDPDLIIRTSGEERLSGFLLWQSAYSELYFCEAYWPEFSKIDFLRAVHTYQSRERRFGR